MEYTQIACCDSCGKKRYVERINGRWLCLDCQDEVTERTAAATTASAPSNPRAHGKDLELLERRCGATGLGLWPSAHPFGQRG